MQEPNPAAVAEAIVTARRTRHPHDALALTPYLATPADAYAVQALVARSIDKDTSPFPQFWKSGGPSRAAQPTHAPLPAAGVWQSPAEAGDWPFNMRLIEVEIALRLGLDVTPADAAALTHENAHELVDAMTVSIEIVDSRWQQGVNAPALFKLADLQSHGALVLGRWVPFARRDWAAQACTVTIGSAAAKEFRGSHTLADPAWVLPAWLLHATRDAATVPVGTVVTTGTWCGMLPAAAGDLVTVRFEGVGEASVQL